MNQPAGTSLDDLLTYEATGHRARRGPVAWWVKAGLTAAGLAAALVLTLFLLGYQLPYPVALGVLLALFGLYRVVSGLGVSEVGRLGGSPQQEADPSAQDQLADAVQLWQTRLSWGRAGIRPFTRTSPLLAELVDERLRLRHGVTMASDPARARELLGERAWRYLADPAASVPPARDLPGLLDDLEKL